MNFEPGARPSEGREMAQLFHSPQKGANPAKNGNRNPVGNRRSVARNMKKRFVEVQKPVFGLSSESFFFVSVLSVS
jgi:hypothetical protein